MGCWEGGIAGRRLCGQVGGLAGCQVVRLVGGQLGTLCE